jgi:hypothetical protein
MTATQVKAPDLFVLPMTGPIRLREGKGIDRPIRLREGKGVDGVLHSLEDGPAGLILVNISGFIVELPGILKNKLEPLLGQEVRVAFLLGRYHAAKLIRRAKT